MMPRPELKFEKDVILFIFEIVVANDSLNATKAFNLHRNFL